MSHLVCKLTIPPPLAAKALTAAPDYNIRALATLTLVFLLTMQSHDDASCIWAVFFTRTLQPSSNVEVDMSRAQGAAAKSPASISSPSPPALIL